MSSIGMIKKPCMIRGCKGKRPYWSDFCKTHREKFGNTTESIGPQRPAKVKKNPVGKKPRTPAQRAATAKMLAANRLFRARGDIGLARNSMRESAGCGLSWLRLPPRYFWLVYALEG